METFVILMQITGFILFGFTIGGSYTRYRNRNYKLLRRKHEEVFPLEEVQDAVRRMGFTPEFAQGLTHKMLASGILFRRVKD